MIVKQAMCEKKKTKTIIKNKTKISTFLFFAAIIAPILLYLSTRHLWINTILNYAIYFEFYKAISIIIYSAEINNALAKI